MTYQCLFIGKTAESYLAAGIADFEKRLGHYTAVQIKILKESRGKLTDAARVKNEGKKLLDAVQPGSYVVVLDRKGKQISSEQLATLCTGWREQGVRTVAFLVGGPVGVSDDILRAADLVLSFSKMTFTHEMARLILLEQLYRAHSIMAGTKYHK